MCFDLMLLVFRLPFVYLVSSVCIANVFSSCIAIGLPFVCVVWLSVCVANLFCFCVICFLSLRLCRLLSPVLLMPCLLCFVMQVKVNISV